MVKIEELKFDDKGLIPAIVIDDASGKLLTLAYMNEESWKKREPVSFPDPVRNFGERVRPPGMCNM